MWVIYTNNQTQFQALPSQLLTQPTPVPSSAFPVAHAAYTSSKFCLPMQLLTVPSPPKPSLHQFQASMQTTKIFNYLVESDKWKKKRRVESKMQITKWFLTSTEPSPQIICTDEFYYIWKPSEHVTPVK